MNAKITVTDTGYKWNDFSGFSILFDNGKDHYRHNLLHNNYEKSSDFYRTLNDVFTGFMKADDILSRREMFLNLDFYSWHVTVWDGINKANFGNIRVNDRHYFSRFMNSLVYNDIHTDIRALIEKSIRWMNTAGEIRFAFRKLYNYENQVLVVSLKPADIDSLEKLHKIKLIRRNLNNYFEDYFGFATGRRYLPHSSLGYFVKEIHGENFRKNQETLNTLLENSLKGKILTFNKVKLFIFSDMVSFRAV